MTKRTTVISFCEVMRAMLRSSSFKLIKKTDKTSQLNYEWCGEMELFIVA